MLGWHHRLDGMSLSKLQELVMERRGWRAPVHKLNICLRSRGLERHA